LLTSARAFPRQDYSEHHAMTYHFPDAFAGTNTKSTPAALVAP